eukprot:GHVT01000628.1.p1 GENE.GHVT01000628.1~~GHVT01000628.1.p1  ORF type:complete len:263 (-),score=73.39 GHVT01000628.1:487-1275(-)
MVSSDAAQAATPTTTLVLVRHGEVLPKHHGTFYGGADVELSEAGKQQAVLAGRLVAAEERPLDCLVSSHLRRAFFGAQQIAASLADDQPSPPACPEASHEFTGAQQPQGSAPCRLEVTVDKRFAEVDRGRWVFLTEKEIDEKFPNQRKSWDTDVRWEAHGGESFHSIQSRVVSALEEYLEKFKGRRICIVSHKVVTQIILAYFSGKNAIESRAIVLPLGSVSKLLVRRKPPPAVPDASAAVADTGVAAARYDAETCYIGRTA